jgi:rubredoxin
MESKKRNNEKKPLDSLNLNFKYFKIYIQCPECGELLKINIDRKYHCKYCEYEYSEKEIREKCGL